MTMTFYCSQRTPIVFSFSALVSVCVCVCMCVRDLILFELIEHCMLHSVMDPERRIAAFPHISEECHTDFKVMRHCSTVKKLK